ncbi:MAG TPA: hypothetical protein VHB70_16540 [Parafilimonas sp.]|nr:hypothetical protein [Parafilimonas sp.]
MKLKELYFFRLYQHNRKLFYGILCFTLFTIICNLRGFEITPFFVWGMYSGKEPDSNTYEVQQVIINDSLKVDITNGYTPSTRFLLESPLWYYMSIRDNNDIDPTLSFLQKKLKSHYPLVKPYEHDLSNDSSRINGFIPWYKKYLEEVTKTKINQLQIINTKVHYSGEKIMEDTSYTIAEWH